MHTSPVRQFSPFFFFFASIAIAIAVALPAIPAIPVIPQAPDLGPHPTIKAQPSEVPTTCTHEICRLGDKVAIVESQKGIDFFSFCHDFIQPNAVPRYAAQHSHCEVCPPIVVKAMKACDDLDRFVATVKRYPSGLPLEKRNTATRKPEADEILTGLVWPPLSMPPIISASVSSTSKVTSLPKRWPVQQTAAKSNSVISIPATTTTRSKTTMAKHITARMNFTVTSVVPESTVSRSRTVSAFSVSTLEEAATKRTSPSPVTMITLTTTTTETMVPQKSSAFVIHTSIMILTMTKTSTARSDEVSSALNPAPSTKIKVDSDPFSKECPMKQEISNPSFEYGWNPGNLFSDPWRYTQDCVIYFDSDRSYLGDHYL